MASNEDGGSAFSLDNLSSFERLPRELVWKIFEFGPQSVFDILLASRSLRSRVIEYALERGSITLVDRVILTVEEAFTVIKMFVPNCKSDLFELRLKLRRTDTRIKRFCDETNSNEYRYEISFTPDKTEFLEELTKNIGRRIGKATLMYCAEKPHLITVSNHLKGINFEKLSVVVETMSEDAVTTLLASIKNHNVTSLTIIFRKVSCSDPVAILLQLSTIVRSLHIHQLNPFGRDRRHRFLFGVYDADWASIIIDLFSKKIDKLFITNSFCPDYISKKSADLIRNILPTIGKKVWFEASCVKYEGGLNYKMNDHSVKAQRIGVFSGTLRIRHSSREDETFE